MEDREWRASRIAELEAELAILRQEQYDSENADVVAVEAECLRLKKCGKPVEAVKFYRDKTGTTLKEAYEVVQRM